MFQQYTQCQCARFQKVLPFLSVAKLRQKGGVGHNLTDQPLTRRLALSAGTAQTDFPFSAAWMLLLCGC